MVANLEMLSGRGKKEYAKEAQAVAATGPDGLPADGMPAAVASESISEATTPDEALVAM